MRDFASGAKMTRQVPAVAPQATPRSRRFPLHRPSPAGRRYGRRMAGSILRASAPEKGRHAICRAMRSRTISSSDMRKLRRRPKRTAAEAALRAYKREILLALMLITLLLLFTTTWVALFLSKQVTVPIQALAEATREISRGNFDHRIEVHAQDELGTLVRSFNRMTEQLGEGPRADQRIHAEPRTGRGRARAAAKTDGSDSRKYSHGRGFAEVPGEVARVNTAVVTILGEYAREAARLRTAGRRCGARRAASDAAVAADGRGFARN